MEKSSNKIIENYIYNTLYQVFNMMVPVITTPYISRVIGANGIGEYSYVSSVVLYFNLFGTLGLAAYGQLEVAKESDDLQSRSRVFWGILTVRTAAMMISIAVYIFLSVCLPVPYRMMHQIQTVYLIAQLADLTWYLMGIDEFKIIAVRNFAVKIIGTLLIFVLVKDSRDVYLYTFIVLATALLGNLSVLPCLRDKVVWTEPKRTEYFVHLKNSFLFFVPAIASSVYQMLDKIMIGLITDSSFQNGLYEQAHKLEQMIVNILTSLSAVMLPRITLLFKKEKHHELRRLISRSCEFTLCIGIPMAAGLFGISDTLIPLFLGDEYTDCIVIEKILSPMIIFAGMDNLIGRECLMAGGRQKQFNTGIILGAVLNILLNLLLIGRLGAYGAAIASVAAELAIFLIFVLYAREILDTGLIKKGGKYICLSLVMLVFVSMIPKVLSGGFLTVAAQLVTGGMVYVTGLLLTKDEVLLYVLNLFLKKSKGK